MALLNFSLPYASPAPPTPYLAGGGLGGYGGYNNPVVNSLWNNPPQQHLGGRQTYNLPPQPPPPAPSRKSTTVPRGTSNDPYRNQLPYQQQQQQSSQQQRPPQQRQQQQQQTFSQHQEAKRPPRYYSDDNYRTNTAAPQSQEDYPANPQQKQDPYPSIPTQNQEYNPPKPSQNQEYNPPKTSSKQESFPSNPSGYTKITDYASANAKTSLHAVIDYDDDFDDYSYDDEDVSELPPDMRHNPMPPVTPIQGPIFLKNGTVPVVPLFAHSVINNGTLVQIPILWTALSVALGLEIRGEIIRGVPCIKRFHQLFCPTAGNSYPIDRIERFIDDNKALMKRMYGEFQMSTEYGPPSRELYSDAAKRTAREAPDDTGGRRKTSRAAPDPVADVGGGESYFSKLRQTRQSFRNNQSSESGRVDACESKVEITTPYWASSSAGKIRAIVNTQHFEQAIHQEVCSSKLQTKRCTGDCGCEQKYKWHRLLAYDPDNDCKGIFMDWFLFPSCCVCRCAPLFGNQ